MKIVNLRCIIFIICSNLLNFFFFQEMTLWTLAPPYNFFSTLITFEQFLRAI